MDVYKPRDPELPPNLPPLPPPTELHIAIPKTNMIIIILLIATLAFLAVHIATEPTPENLRVFCQPPTRSLILDNNIQASHAYTGQMLSNRDTLTCVKADDHGTLFGNSMQPTFFEGNTILLQNYTPDKELHTGDLIRYFRFNEQHPNCTVLREQLANNSLGGSWVNNSMAVIHRISAIYDDDIITQGDNLYEQEHITKCQITDIAIGVLFT